MKKKIHIAKEIAKIKSHIRSSFPRALKVNVHFKKEKDEEYKSLIRVKTPHKKELIAIKRDSDPKKSLEKSYAAISKQIGKLKTRYKKRGRPVFEYLY